MENQKDLERRLFLTMRRLHHQMPRWVILIILLIIFTVFAYYVSSLLIILLLSGVVAYLLSAVVNNLESLGLRRKLIVVTLFICFAGLIAGAEIILSPYLQKEIKNFYSSLPEISHRIETVLRSTSVESAKKFPRMDASIRKMLNEVITPGNFINKTLNLSEIFSQATSFIFGLVLVPFFAFFLLKDWPRILKTLMGWIPPVYVETTVSLVSEINILAGKYLRGLAIDCITLGIIASSGLWLMGINYPISLGILTGAANVIPYLGPAMACLAASLIAFFQFDSIAIVLNIVLFYVSIKLIDDLVILPLTIGKSVRLHPMLLVITIIVGEKLFGIIGMIIAVPIVTITQKAGSILIDNYRRTVERRNLPDFGGEEISQHSGHIPL